MKLFLILAYILIILALLTSGFNLYSILVETKQAQENSIDAFEASLLTDSFETTEPNSVALSLLDMEGVLYVPSIGLKIPIYKGTSEEAISEGAGLIEGTGDLKGSLGQNPIVTSHNGASFKDLFVNLPKVLEGDNFYVKNKEGEVFEYEVFQATDYLAAEEVQYIKEAKSEESFMTLRTCTPFGINSHRRHTVGRLLGEIKEGDIPEMTLTFSLNVIILLVVFILSLTGLIFFIISDVKHYKERA